MVTPHAGFAAVAVVPERLINQCLNTYLVNTLDSVRAEISYNAPIVVNGAQLTLQIWTAATLLSVNAKVRRNITGDVELTFRLHGTLSVTIFQLGVAIETYTPEVLLDATVTARLVSLVSGGQFQFGVDLQRSRVDALQPVMVGGGLIPDAYIAQVRTALASPSAAQTVTNVLRTIAAQLLRATPATVPASFDLPVSRPDFPDQEWFRIRGSVSRLVWLTLNGGLLVAIDLEGFTNGNHAALVQYWENQVPEGKDLPPPAGWYDAWPHYADDFVCVANLDFVEQFLAREIFPRMVSAFFSPKVRLDRVRWLTFRWQRNDESLPVNFEVELDVTFYTHNWWHFVVAGSTAVHARPRIRGRIRLIEHRLGASISYIDGVPLWVQAAIGATSLLLLPFSIVFPSWIQDVLRSAINDAINSANGDLAQNAVGPPSPTPLPDTAGPPYRIEPWRFQVVPAEGGKSATSTVTLRPGGRGPYLTAVIDASESVTLPPNPPSWWAISQIGSMPVSINLRLFVPPGIVQPNDPTVVVRWETFLNGKVLADYCRWQRFREPGSTELKIFTILFMRPNKTDQELKVTCRLFRAFAGNPIEEFFNYTVPIVSIDPRPDSLKPYVQWSHWVRYWNGYKHLRRLRLSKIHKVPGKGGCLFSGSYLRMSRAPYKLHKVRHLGDLPFDIEDILDNLDAICPYCFFGGPDKAWHYSVAVAKREDLDFTGFAARFARPNP